ncbi:MAG: hypothetical protein HYT77_01670 [Deltaproteobacteria bacterium]|nr:hypothetical protein [Deltaproteobacteria bacterium]
MSIHHIAKVLGRRGGRERARRLSSKRTKEIASFGGRVRAESLKIAKRIEENFRYVQVIRQLTESPPAQSLKTAQGKLPEIHG